MLGENIKMRYLRLLVLQKKPPHHMRFFQLSSLMPVHEISEFLIQVILITYVLVEIDLLPTSQMMAGMS